MYRITLALSVVAVVVAASAKTVVITVGNTTSDAKTVFTPNSVAANAGDTVLFNFTHGNHTATQSAFSSPCVPIHKTNVTVNGFDSSFRDAGNEQAVTTLPVTINDNITTIWFYDSNTCAEGGVGGININSSSTETLAGFQRNAERLNGTATASSTATSPVSSETGSATNSSSKPTKTNDASRITAQGAGAIMLTLVALAASL
ncbi:hypothetical protein H0H92_008640 [Tricholoma furcatifolium]|nr:hypothetical protein H0H92_008640 [Tricholoma furcatifolium]